MWTASDLSPQVPVQIEIMGMNASGYSFSNTYEYFAFKINKPDNKVFEVSTILWCPVFAVR
jgi:hypothetical protein